MYSETAADLGRKFNECWILWEGKLSVVASFDGGEDGPITFSIRSKPREEWRVVEWDEAKVEVIQPNAMMFNQNKLGEDSNRVLATEYRRTGQRQYHRSLSHQNSVFTCPLRAIYDRVGLPLMGWNKFFDWSTVPHLINPVYPKIDEARKYIEKHQAIAISPQFALTLSPKDENLLIVSMFGFIGELQKDKSVIYHQPLFQEYRDFLDRSNQMMPIEVCPN